MRYLRTRIFKLGLQKVWLQFGQTLSLRFCYFGQGLTWATSGTWTQNCSQEYVGACPGHHLQLIVRNLVFGIFKGEPPPP